MTHSHPSGQTGRHWLGRLGALSALALALSLGLSTASSWAVSWFKLLPPTHEPIYVRRVPPMHEQPHVSPVPPVKNHVLENRVRSLSAQDVFGEGILDRNHAQDLSKYDYRPIDPLKQTLRPGELAAAEEFLGYGPAAALANQMLHLAPNAKRAGADYKEYVGDTEFADLRQLPGQTEAAKAAAPQMASRLILKAFESVEDSHLPHGTQSEYQQLLMDALHDAPNPAAREGIWATIFSKDYDPAVYGPEVQVSAPSQNGIVDYRVDSRLLPSTSTPIDVAGLGKWLSTQEFLRGWGSRSSRKQK